MIKENGTYHSDCPAGKDKGQNHTQNQISESGGHDESATYNLHKDFFIEHKIHMEPDMEVLALPLLEKSWYKYPLIVIFRNALYRLFRIKNVEKVLRQIPFTNI